MATFSLEQVFPIIEQIIADLCETDEIAPRDEIARQLVQRDDSRALVSTAYDQNQSGWSEQMIAGNMVDWFSAKFTANDPLLDSARSRFERQKMRGKWSYYPVGSPPKEFAVDVLPADTQEEGLERPPRVPMTKQARQQVIVDAGNRCAACGHSPPIVSHIIPLSSGGESTGDNLVALCPNCHARADIERWDEQTLRGFKEKPWVSRRESSQQPANKVGTVTVMLNVDIDALDDLQADRIRSALAQFLQAKDSDIKILRVEKG